MRISDWSSDVCSSALLFFRPAQRKHPARACPAAQAAAIPPAGQPDPAPTTIPAQNPAPREQAAASAMRWPHPEHARPEFQPLRGWPAFAAPRRSEEHTSELQSLMRISYAVFCLKKKKIKYPNTYTPTKSANQLF